MRATGEHLHASSRRNLIDTLHKGRVSVPDCDNDETRVMSLGNRLEVVEGPLHANAM